MINLVMAHIRRYFAKIIVSKIHAIEEVAYKTFATQVKVERPLKNAAEEIFQRNMDSITASESIDVVFNSEVIDLSRSKQRSLYCRVFEPVQKELAVLKKQLMSYVEGVPFRK